MRLVVTAFMTLDGIIEAPGFDEHRSGRNAWALRVQNDEDEVYNRGQALSADAFLLGRRTWQIWAAFWPTASGGDDELTEWMNTHPEVRRVAHAQACGLEQHDDHLGRRRRARSRSCKAKPGGELLVYGSPDLVDELLRHDLVDEYRLLVYPVILGSGKRMFRDRIDTHHLRLVDSRTFSSGVVLLTYVPDAEVPTSHFVEEYQWTPEQIRSLQAAEDIDRTLATVLFADIVDSTGRAAAMGDRAWKKLLEQHQRVVESEIERWHGQNVEFTGDGVMAVFDAPDAGAALRLRARRGRPRSRRRDAGRHPHRGDRAPRDRRRRHRGPHRGSGPGPGGTRRRGRDEDRARPGDRHRPGVPSARRCQPARRARPVGAVRGEDLGPVRRPDDEAT